MRTMLAIIVGLIGGFVLGIVLSSLIGVISYMFLDEPVGFKFLPHLTSIIGAIATPIMDKKSKKE